MGQLGMTLKEYDYYIENLAEAFMLIGQEAKLYQVLVEEKDMYHDPSLEYGDYVNVGVIFEDNPKPILKKYNWFVEDEELPFVCYLVAKDNDGEPVDVRENCILEIPSKYGLETERRFLTISVRGSSIDPLAWICKLVPLRNKIDMIPATLETDTKLKPQDDVGFSYLKR